MWLVEVVVSVYKQLSVYKKIMFEVHDFNY